MAKGLPPVKTGSSAFAKAAGLLIGLAVLMLITKHPGDSANWVTGLFHLLGSLVDGISDFLHDLSA